MDESVRRALAKWPDVPACHGWLSLDRAGRWRLQGQIVIHKGMADFIARNYVCDATGCWLFQNGPQRVFVTLEYTPWVLRTARNSAAAFVTHTHQAFTSPTDAWLDEAGNLLISGPLGVGLVHGQDLIELADAITLPAADKPGVLEYAGLSLPVVSIAASEVPARFGFQANPKPDQA
jgi:hypothetical protein